MGNCCLTPPTSPGSNSAGPVSTVSVMDVGTYAVPRTPLIAPFPSFMTQGSGRTFSVFGGRALNTCPPGYTARAQLLPASTFGPLFGRQVSGRSAAATRAAKYHSQSYVPGSCNEYDFSTRQWTTSGGKMTTAREGGSTLNVGSYIMSFGGFNTFGQPVTTVEVVSFCRSLCLFSRYLSPDIRPPAAARGLAERAAVELPPRHAGPLQCRHPRPRHRPQRRARARRPRRGGVRHEAGARHQQLVQVSADWLALPTLSSDWCSVPPMRHGRTSHGCTPLTLNGRPGVVVSGGWDAARANTSSSVEFFDMNTHR